MASKQVAIKSAKPMRNTKWGYVKRNKDLYYLVIPGLLFLLAFHYLPMFGIVIAFKDYNIFLTDNAITSIFASPWVGLKHFYTLFSRPEFGNVLRNTVLISVYKMVFLFPLPMVLSLLLNEVRSVPFKRITQTVIYLPHFISWTIVAGLFISILGARGPVNQLITWFGGTRILFFMDKSWFRTMLVVTDGWKETGWGTIVYLASITAINPELYEAAVVDGAGRWKQAWHVTLPGMREIIVMLLILRVGNLLNAGFEQIFVMYNTTVYDVADIIGTYVYRIGLGKLNFSFGTAMGLFNSVVSFILVYSTNTIARRVVGRAIW